MPTRIKKKTLQSNAQADTFSRAMMLALVGTGRFEDDLALLTASFPTAAWDKTPAETDEKPCWSRSWDM